MKTSLPTKRNRLFYMLCVIAVVAAVLYFASQPKAVNIRACLVLNPRFDSITDAEYASILRSTKVICRKHFNVDLQYTQTDKLNIDNYFAPHLRAILADDKIRKRRLAPVTDSIGKLTKALIAEHRDESRDKVIGAVRNQDGAELIDLNTSKEDILRQVSVVHVNKLIQIKDIKLSDNRPLITADLYNEFTSWAYIAEHQNDYDFIITNQPLISVEAYSPAIHQSMRGGITSGFGGSSPTRLGGLIIVSTFPMVSTINYFRNARGQNYSEHNRIGTIAMLAGHEFGHVVKYWDHQYDHPSCIMRPAPGLKYIEWVDEISAGGPCKRNHYERYKAYFTNMRLNQ